MKLNLIVLSSVLALALAQESSTTTAAPTASLSPEQKCATKCGDADLCCKAECFKVPCPSDQMANDTTACAANCKQGSGSASDTAAYAKCQQNCYSSLFFPATASVTDSPSSTNTDSSTATTTGSSSETGSGSDHSGSSTSSSGTPTSNSAPTDTPNMATTQLKVGVSAAGLTGFLLAAWAL